MKKKVYSIRAEKLKREAKKRRSTKKEEKRIYRVFLILGLFWLLIYLPISSFVHYFGMNWLFIVLYIVSVPLGSYVYRAYVVRQRAPVVELILLGLLYGVGIASVIITPINLWNIVSAHKSEALEHIEYCPIVKIDNKGTIRGVAVELQNGIIYLAGYKLHDAKGEVIKDLNEASNYRVKVYYREGFFNSTIVLDRKRVKIDDVP